MHTTAASPERQADLSTSCWLEPPLVSPSIRPSWYSFFWLHHRPKSHMMSTQNITSRRSLRNQTVGIKTWVRATEYHPIQQTAGKICTSFMILFIYTLTCCVSHNNNFIFLQSDELLVSTSNMYTQLSYMYGNRNIVGKYFSWWWRKDKELLMSLKGSRR
jgi:hypothetical protein